MRLSKQSIRKLCEGDAPMIHPFEPSKVRMQGVSKGLSHASYDASIAHDLVLGRHPGYVIKEWVIENLSVLIGAGPLPERPMWWLPRIKKTVQVVYTMLGDLGTLAQRLRDEPPAYALAHTIEDFHMPDNVGGDVADKSTFARVFVSAYNTFFDPGFHGNATLELVNDSNKRVEYKAGQGVCQFIFTWLDEPTEEPYVGKYQNQAKRPQAAIFEPDEVGVRNRHEVQVDEDRIDAEHAAAREIERIIEDPKLSAGRPTPHAPVAATATQATDLSRYRWGEKPGVMDKYAGQPDHAVRGWEPK